jgi:hypothetical protein
MRRVLATAHDLDSRRGDDNLARERDAAFDALRQRVVDRFGDPVFDDRLDRAAIDTWYPTARRFAAWPHPDGLVFLALERSGRRAPLAIVVGHASDEEVERRRRDRGHSDAGSRAAAAGAAPTAPFATILGADLLAYARGRPQGLNRISQRPRDRAIRWLLFVLAIGIVIAMTGALILARHA